jgi:uncharacterized low-complexity protein
MANPNKSLALTVSSIFLLSIGNSSFAASENPFTVISLSNGYQVADADMTKMKDGKCGTGKSGANKKKMMEKMSAEGKCSAEKMKDGGCSAEMKASMDKSDAADKAKDGKCSADMKKSGEGKCSANKK